MSAVAKGHVRHTGVALEAFDAAKVSIRICLCRLYTLLSIVEDNFGGENGRSLQYKLLKALMTKEKR